MSGGLVRFEVSPVLRTDPAAAPRR